MDFKFFQTPRHTRLSLALLESTDAGVFGMDLEGCCTYVNSAGAVLLRVAPNDLLGVDLHRLIHVAPSGNAEHAPNECPIVRAAVSQEPVLVNDELLWRPDQTHFPADLIVSPILEHEVVTGTLVVLRDTTPRPRGAETAQREGEAYFRVMADTAPVLIWVSGQDKACTYFNRGWLEFRGRTLEQEFGHGWAEGVHPEDAERVIATYSEAFDMRQPYRLEYRLRRADGAYRWILVSGTPRYSDNGVFAGYVGSCLDITERRTAETERDRLLVAERAAREQAETAIQQRDELLALVSHDLRSPVGTIRGWAQLLQRRATRGLSGEQDRDRLLDGLRQIEGSTVRMAMLIDELLDFAQMEAGQQLELDQQPTDLVGLARLAAAEHQASSGRHRIQVKASSLPVMGTWDAPRLRRVLDNLLSNALKYSPAGGEINVKVDVDPDGHRALLEVSDHGVGIPAGETSRIFERFYRASNAPGRVVGFGIGLAGVRQIVEQHGGTITVESKEGQGSSFTLHLPLNPEDSGGRGEHD